MDNGCGMEKLGCRAGTGAGGDAGDKLGHAKVTFFAFFDSLHVIRQENEC